MRLTPPKKIVFWISFFLAVLGLVFAFVAPVKDYAVVPALIGYALLFAGNAVKGF